MKIEGVHKIRRNEKNGGAVEIELEGQNGQDRTKIFVVWGNMSINIEGSRNIEIFSDERSLKKEA